MQIEVARIGASYTNSASTTKRGGVNPNQEESSLVESNFTESHDTRDTGAMNGGFQFGVAKKSNNQNTPYALTGGLPSETASIV